MCSSPDSFGDATYRLSDDLMRKPSTTVDVVNHPPHYTSGPIEVIDIIEGFSLPYHLGNVVKYLLRCTLKGAELQDLKKAQWYLNRYISNLESK